MNRRNFIKKSLLGLIAIPFVKIPEIEEDDTIEEWLNDNWDAELSLEDNSIAYSSMSWTGSNSTSAMVYPQSYTTSSGDTVYIDRYNCECAIHVLDDNSTKEWVWIGDKDFDLKRLSNA